MSEAQLQDSVLELARRLRYRVAHFGVAQVGGRWVTPVQADGAGWPDLALARPGRFLVAELKSAKGKLSGEQQDWLSVLARAGVEIHVWYPHDWQSGLVERVLR